MGRGAQATLAEIREDFATELIQGRSRARAGAEVLAILQPNPVLSQPKRASTPSPPSTHPGQAGAQPGP